MAASYVLCPECSTPCSLRAVECDVCGQPLGEVPDYAPLQRDLRVWRKRAIQGGAAFVFLAIANAAVFRTGFLFLVLPGGVSLLAVTRYRELARRLRGAGRPSTF
ncbi:MAG: hypothetical protein CMN30_03235 [Sandaracinus sp.]|nr:hypothetical protein [Sandaracinus sp.]